jgi:glucose/arabinose dehydrogenase
MNLHRLEMMVRPRRCVAGLIAAVLAAAPAHAGWNGATRLTTGLGAVTTMAQLPSDPGHAYVGIKEGAIKRVNLATGEIQPALYLNLFGQIDAELEGGLSGLAFHPDYVNNGKIYVTVTVDNGGIVIDPGNETTPPTVSPYTAFVREYTRSAADPNVIDTSSFKTILHWVKPQMEHTGGWLGFGPDDGMLYIATGDGGILLDDSPGHTPGIGNAQDMTDNWFGKMLRVDVDGDDFPEDDFRSYAVPLGNPFVGSEGDDEIFANGIRSPWGGSFDRQTGDLWFGDVGENHREEINVIPAGTSGQNFGWRLREGSGPTPYDVGGDPPPRNVHPEYDYRHIGVGETNDFQGNSVVGGYVYRGPDTTLQGKYVFADFVSRKIWMFDPGDPYGAVTNITPQLLPDEGMISSITSFFEDVDGNLYIGTISGNFFRLDTEIRPGDFQPDGYVDSDDLALWQEFYGLEDTDYRDADGDGDFDGNDFLLWQRNLTLPPEGMADSAAVPEPAAGSLAVLALAAMSTRRRRGRPA